MYPLKGTGATSSENHGVDDHGPLKEEAFTQSPSVFIADVFPNLQSTTGNVW